MKAGMTRRPTERRHRIPAFFKMDEVLSPAEFPAQATLPGPPRGDGLKSPQES